MTQQVFKARYSASTTPRMECRQGSVPWQCRRGSELCSRRSSGKPFARRRRRQITRCRVWRFTSPSWKTGKWSTPKNRKSYYPRTMKLWRYSRTTAPSSQLYEEVAQAATKSLVTPSTLPPRGTISRTKSTMTTLESKCTQTGP